MYNWRKINDTEKCKVMKYRKMQKLPWHCPPHFEGSGLYHLTAANYEHKIIIGKDFERMQQFENELLSFLESENTVKAWCILPNHYHLLIDVEDLKKTLSNLGKFHGKLSFLWNKEEDKQGRKCWHGVADRKIRNADHYYATLNYIHHNPVKHKYVRKWNDWKYSSAKQFLEEVGKESALKLWIQYPVLDYGKGWDD
jgi:putative transposase